MPTEQPKPRWYIKDLVRAIVQDAVALDLGGDTTGDTLVPARVIGDRWIIALVDSGPEHAVVAHLEHDRIKTPRKFKQGGFQSSRPLPRGSRGSFYLTPCPEDAATFARRIVLGLCEMRLDYYYPLKPTKGKT